MVLSLVVAPQGGKLYRQHMTGEEEDDPMPLLPKYCEQMAGELEWTKARLIGGALKTTFEDGVVVHRHIPPEELYLKPEREDD